MTAILNGDQLDKEKLRILKKLKDDPVFFARVVLGFEPYPYQIDLLRTPSKRIVAVWGRQSGKTTCIGMKVTHKAWTEPNITIIIVSKGLRQSIIMFSVITNVIMNNPILRKSIARFTRTQIWLKNRSTIIALPCGTSGANLRGHTAHMIVMDEAAFMPETVITQVIFPMLATTGGTAIMLSTPWGRNHVFYRNFCNPSYWTQRIKSRDCPRITAEFLAEQREMLGDLRYRIEYEAEFIEDQNALFTQDMIRRCVERWDDETHKVWTDADLEALTTKRTDGVWILGCDLGKRMDYSVIVILKREMIDIIDSELGRPRRIQIWRLFYKKEFPLQTKLYYVMNKIKWLNSKLKIRAGCIDSTGIGEAPVEILSTKLRWVEGIPLYAAVRKHEVAMFAYTEIEKGNLGIPNDKELITQMNEQCFGYSAVKTKIETEEKGIMVYWHPEGRHDDQLWALILAIYSYRDM